GKKVDVVGVCRLPDLYVQMRRIGGRILLLEDIQDPGNLGTIFRCAEAFGFLDVICVMSSETAISRIFSRVTIRASMGSIFRIRLYIIPSAAEAIDFLDRRNITFFASTPHSEFTLEDLTSRLSSMGEGEIYAIGVGNEASGLSRKFLEFSQKFPNFPVRISMLGSVESLNVAVACGIILHRCHPEPR
ncbi:hypothetical protein AAMO2058_001338700, partial [Amorphochlora amoebiformis]